MLGAAPYSKKAIFLKIGGDVGALFVAKPAHNPNGRTHPR